MNSDNIQCSMTLDKPFLVLPAEKDLGNILLATSE